jgi:hypothetical protein
MDVFNRDIIVGNFQPDGVMERDANLPINRRAFDILSGRVEVERIVVRDGARRSWRYSIRMLTFTELRCWLRGAGFSAIDGYDKADGSPLAMDTQRMLIVATR